MSTHQRVNVNRTNLICVLFLIYLCTATVFAQDPPVLNHAKPTAHQDRTKNSHKNRPDPDVVQMSKDRHHRSGLANSPECHEDATRICSPENAKGDFGTLTCLLEHSYDNPSAIDEPCQHLMWEYRANYTMDKTLARTAGKLCEENINEHCSQDQLHGGKLLSCLIENMEAMGGKGPCRAFLNRILTVVFGDYKFMEQYFTKCTDDVKKLKCGRTQAKDAEQFWMHTEGSTIACLQESKDKVTKECKKELLKVAELQSDDFHMDRALYYACKDARETFCSSVNAGGGAIYNCLMTKAKEPKMPPLCHNMLIRRQKMIDEDVKIDSTFFHDCKADIETYKCNKDKDEESPHRTHVMMCLEDAHKKGSPLSAECMIQIGVQRQEVMENPEINEDFADACKPLLEYCSKKPNMDGTKVMHCIMDLVENESKKKSPVHITPECKKQLKVLLEEVDVADDYTMDTSLRRTCAGDIRTICAEEKEGDSRVLGCLMSNLDNSRMNPLCVKYLHQINYFIVRDYRLDSELRRNCHKDAVNICQAPNAFQHDGIDDNQSDSDRFVLPCLYRDRKKLDPQCRDSVKRLMHERAVSVDMMPELEGPCLQDLADKCSTTLEKGAEIQCLENNLESLTEKCRTAIESFIEEEDEDIEMDQVLIKACQPAIRKLCQDEMKDGEQADTEDLLDCLIENKHNPEMPHKCAQAVTHHELTLMKDFHFSHKFNKSCNQDTKTHCAGKKRKYDVVMCLSEIARDDILNDAENPRIKKTCRKQLQAELFERTRDIDLDPDLKEKCSDDIKKFCENVNHGPGAILHCLKNHQQRLSQSCMTILFSREVLDAAMNIVDVTILSTCQAMTNLFCKDARISGDLMSCLKSHKNDPNFDRKCREALIQRQITENQDYRLNPELNKACHKDIGTFCSHITKNQKEDTMLEGQVISCLKKRLIKKKLSHDCAAHVTEIVRDAALDFREDASLISKCHKDITKLCSKDLEDPDNIAVIGQPGSEGNVEDCLKQNFQRIQDADCQKEVARLFNEGRVDIHSDPHLYEACQRIVKVHCSDVVPGEGRVMACLLDLHEERRVPAGKCRNRLMMRKQMWEYAAKVLPPENIGEILDSINASESRGYLIGVILAILGIILIAGVMCGRVTKRVRTDIKNR